MIQFYHINYLFSVLTFPPLPAQIISLFLFFILRLSYLCSHFSLTWSSDYLLLVLTFNLPLPPSSYYILLVLIPPFLSSDSLFFFLDFNPLHPHIGKWQQSMILILCCHFLLTIAAKSDSPKMKMALKKALVSIFPLIFLKIKIHGTQL